MTPTPTPPTEKVLLKYPDGRTEEHETETLTFKDTTDKGLELNWKALATKKLLDNGFAEKTAAEAVIALEKIVEYRAKEEYERGYLNGFKQGRFDTEADAINQPS